jgi:3D (Asp-Asp-Asp) domain-containing protein
MSTLTVGRPFELQFDRPAYPDTMRAPPPDRLAVLSECAPTTPQPVLRSLILSSIFLVTLTSYAEDAKKTTATPTVPPGTVISGVRTTAYTHTEADHIEYGSRTGAGTGLLHGKVRSAAADWSIYPVGTVFQISGDSNLYLVDDYGSALVGTRTIDIYKPTTSAMNSWGTRTVTIRILKWGSYTKSLAILKPRAFKASHVREMVSRLVKRVTT